MKIGLAGKVLLATTMFILPIVVLELGLRVFTSQDSQWNVRIGGNKQFDPVTRVRNKPDFAWTPRISTNEHGYLAPRGLAFQRPPDSIRMIFMGDSVTFFPVERNYPTLLEEELEAATGRDIEILNASVAGFASDNVRAMLEAEILDYDADYFFVYVGWNDLGQYGPDGLPFKKAETGYELSPLERILSDFYLVRIPYALQRYLKHGQPSRNAPLSEEEVLRYAEYYPRHFEENLRAILDQAKARYPKVYVANLATITNPDPTEWELETAHFPAGMDKNMRKLDMLVHTYNRVIDDVAASEGVPVIDLYSAFDSREARKLLTDSCHVKEPGARRIVSIIREEIGL